MLDVKAFVEVATRSSFVKASRRLRMPRATVSRRVARLEERVGVRLFQRTTRSVQITSAGELLLQHASRILHELDGAQLSLEKLSETPSGPVVISAPIILGQALLGQIIDEFVTSHPNCTPELTLTNQKVGLVTEGIDVAFRVGPLTDSALIAKRMGQVEAALYVSSDRAFRDEWQAIEPSSLAGANILVLGNRVAEINPMKLVNEKNEVASVTFEPKLFSTDPQILLPPALSGRGIAVLPTFVAAPFVRQGKLKRVLKNWAVRRSDVHILLPSAKLMRPGVRSFIEIATNQMRLALQS
nr:LysR substrate-binding domain-containing protein [uncultured Erythrobacter sp.]